MMKRLPKLLALVLCGTLSLGLLTACGSSDPEQDLTGTCWFNPDGARWFSFEKKGVVKMDAVNITQEEWSYTWKNGAGTITDPNGTTDELTWLDGLIRETGYDSLLVQVEKPFDDPGVSYDAYLLRGQWKAEAAEVTVQFDGSTRVSFTEGETVREGRYTLVGGLVTVTLPEGESGEQSYQGTLTNSGYLTLDLFPGQVFHRQNP